MSTYNEFYYLVTILYSLVSSVYNLFQIALKRSHSCETCNSSILNASVNLESLCILFFDSFAHNEIEHE